MINWIHFASQVSDFIFLTRKGCLALKQEQFFLPKVHSFQGSEAHWASIGKWKSKKKKRFLIKVAESPFLARWIYIRILVLETFLNFTSKKCSNSQNQGIGLEGNYLEAKLMERKKKNIPKNFGCYLYCINVGYRLNVFSLKN